MHIHVKVAEKYSIVFTLLFSPSTSSMDMLNPQDRKCQHFLILEELLRDGESLCRGLHH